MDNSIYTTHEHSMELDEAIMRLKSLGRRVTVNDLLTLTNIEYMVEMLQIIDRLEIPLRMNGEGYS